MIFRHLLEFKKANPDVIVVADGTTIGSTVMDISILTADYSIVNQYFIGE